MDLGQRNYIIYGENIDSNEFVDAIIEFAELHYKKGEYESRHWGNNRHSICSYPSKLTPSIPYHIIDTFTNQGERVLDPMSGVGTIPFEASLNGRVGIGNDLNPLAYTVTRAKLMTYNAMEVHASLGKLKKYIDENRGSYDLSKVEPEIQDFFHKKTLREILAAKTYLENKHQNRHYLIKACISHILHGNRPYALSRRSHNVIPIPPKGDFVYKPLIKSLSEKIERTLKVELPTIFEEGTAYQEDAFKINEIITKVDCIITSPPFLKTTEFLRQNRVRLWFNGWSYEEQESRKERFLENMPLTEYSKLLPIFHECIKDNGLCIFHTGVVNGEDMAREIASKAERHGFAPLSIIYEVTDDMESQGRTDRGGTKEHQFLILRKL